MKLQLKTMVLAAAALLLPAAGFCAGIKMEAVAAFVQGDAQLKRAAGGDYAPLEMNAALQAGDAIKTGPGAKVSVISKTGAEIRVNENTVFEIPKKDKNIFELLAGQVWSRMLHKRAKLSVRTPTAVCAIRGTEADIEQAQLLTVKVYEGHVDLSNALGKQALRAGELSTVTGSGAPAAPRQMTQADQGTWQSTVEVKDIGKHLASFGLDKAGMIRNLNLQIEEGGKTKDINIRLKKK